MIQTECKGCGQKLKLPDDMAGKRAHCPSCGDPVKVPGASAAALSAERPQAGTPPPGPPQPKMPVPRRPAPVAQAAAPSSTSPFDFTNPAPRISPPANRPAPAPVAQLAPPANVELVFAEPAAGSPVATFLPRRRRSLARPLASYGAMIGAALGVTLFVLLGPSEETISEGLGRVARGKLTIDHVRGALVGLIGGLLIGSALVAVVGRSLPSVAVGCLLMIAGAAFGAFRQSGAGELSPMLLLAAAYAGLIVGAALGALLGAVVGMSSE
jgi:hypothetical protein